jgi:arsenite methyltransferase
MSNRTARADYGIDAPGVIRNMFLVATGLILLAVAGTWIPALSALRPPLLSIAISFLASGCLMILSSRYGKLRARDRLLDGLRLSGNERVLDVGCGHGLLLIGAARRVPRGSAVGIDLWSQTDQGRNTREATLANAVAEGVMDRVDVRDGDMRELPFGEASFDAVVASLSIHNIPSRDGRRAAINEIVRVLKPGGKVALMDIAHTGQYAEDLRAAGLRDVKVSAWSPWIFPPTRTVTGTRN